MSSVVVCECCMSDERDTLLELSRVHKTPEGLEVYREMLSECFSIVVPSYPHGGMICALCVERLRQASSFRRQVLTTQRQLKDMAAGKDEKRKIKIEVKVEKSDDEATTSEESGSSDEEATPKRLIMLKDIKYETKPAKVGEPNIMKPKVVRKSLQQQKLGILLGLTDDVADVTKTKMKGDKRHENSKNVILVHSREAIIANVSLILANSSATPFRGHYAHGYRCYYCNESFEDPNLLRDHTINQHAHEKLSGEITVNAKNSFDTPNFFIYLDIKDLTCLICEETFTHLASFKTHLVDDHEKSFLPEVGDRCIPFVLEEDLHCKCCSEKFVSFRALVFHMNVHFPNAVCDICKEGFITQRRLNNHMQSHGKDNFQCSHCPKMFKAKGKLYLHESAVHNVVSRFRCPHCLEKFFSYAARMAHLIKEHGGKVPEYKCKVCTKIFTQQSAFNAHMRKDHWGERRYICSSCGVSCFTQHDLNKHMVSHNAPEMHTCDICNKTFMRANSLREHTRLSHSEKRFVCSVCGVGFMERLNLDRHMKKKHPYVQHEEVTDSDAVVKMEHNYNSLIKS